MKCPIITIAQIRRAFGYACEGEEEYEHVDEHPRGGETRST
jgi:hypothetical protein